MQCLGGQQAAQQAVSLVCLHTFCKLSLGHLHKVSMSHLALASATSALDPAQFTFDDCIHTPESDTVKTGTTLQYQVQHAGADSRQRWTAAFAAHGLGSWPEVHH